MKRVLTALLLLGLCLGILAACGQNPPGGSSASGVTGGASSPQSAGAAVALCRIVKEEDGVLLLAAQEGTEVYRVNASGVPVILDGQSGSSEDLDSGMLVEVCYEGGIQESYPAGFGTVTSINVQPDGFDNMAEFYLQVLEDLWAVDSGLNEGISELGVDLSGTRLSQAEQSAVAWAFGESHGLTAIQGTYEELAEQGYFSMEVPSGTSDSEGSGDAPKLYQWEDGCLFSIEEKDDPVVFNLLDMGAMETGGGEYDAVCFDAKKWSSGTGAYYFNNCTAVRMEGGAWDKYTIESQAIS